MLGVCCQLKYDYFTYCNVSKTQCESNPWVVDRGTVFRRPDAFVARCEDLIYVCQTAQQFEKMLAVVIGGICGSALTNDVEGSIDGVATKFNIKKMQS